MSLMLEMAQVIKSGVTKSLKMFYFLTLSNKVDNCLSIWFVCPSVHDLVVDKFSSSEIDICYPGLL